MVEVARLFKQAGAQQILRSLVDGPKTFGELSSVVNVHTLQRRLKELASEKLVTRRVLDNRRVLYALTPEGLETAAKVLTMSEAVGVDFRAMMGGWYEGFMKEWRAYWKVRDSLLTRYRGKYVAVCDSKIAGTGSSLHEAASRARQKHPMKPLYVGRVGYELVPHTLRSPKIGVSQLEAVG